MAVRPAARGRIAAQARRRLSRPLGQRGQADGGREDSAGRASPIRKDKRFADPEWSENQFFDFLKQAYLLSTHWAEQLVADAQSLDPHTRQKAEFYIRQIANAISPSNFVLTNPELLRETLSSNAENLVRGMTMLTEDIDEKGNLKIRQSDPKMFEVGRNLAVTPGKVDFPERADAAHPVHARRPRRC